MTIQTQVRPCTAEPACGPEDWEERRCVACREYWPADTEFFAGIGPRGDRLSTRCLACIKARFWGYRTCRAD
jgi:hypothetical protein